MRMVVCMGNEPAFMSVLHEFEILCCSLAELAVDSGPPFSLEP